MKMMVKMEKRKIKRKNVAEINLIILLISKYFLINYNI